MPPATSRSRSGSRRLVKTLCATAILSGGVLALARLAPARAGQAPSRALSVLEPVVLAALVLACMGLVVWTFVALRGRGSRPGRAAPFSSRAEPDATIAGDAPRDARSTTSTPETVVKWALEQARQEGWRRAKRDARSATRNDPDESE